MPVANRQIDALSDSDRRRLERFLLDFEQSWQPGSLGPFAAQLQSEHPAYLAAALEELAKIDMERSWKVGIHMRVEEYLNVLPDSAAMETMSAKLVQTEYDLRRRNCESVDLNEYRRRFPDQFPSLEQWLADPGTVLYDDGDARSHRSMPHCGTGQHRPFTAFPTRFGKYVIECEIGVGGMGTVYLARDTSLYRDVAIKTPHLCAGSEQVYREAQLAAKLRHANICPVYEVGEREGVYFIAMAYIEGPTLAKWLETFGPLSPLKAARLTATLAVAIAEAHRHGVVHRDLKPANVLIDRGGELLLTDFGLATTSHEPGQVTNSSSSGLQGTPMYMSPEQAECRHGDVGPRSDIYSLGVVLYEMLTGQPPFRGTAADVITRITQCEPELPSKLCPGLAPKLERICLTMMAKRIDQRYATMQHVADALERFLRGTCTNGHAAALGRLVPVAPVDSGQSIQLVARPAPDSAKTSAAAPDTDSSRRGTRRKLLLVMLAVAAVWLGTTLLIRTATGTLRVVVDDPTLQVEVDNAQIAINGSWEGKKWPGEHRLRVRIGGQELRLDAPVVLRLADGVSEYRLGVELNGATLSSNEFEIRRGQTTVLKVTHQATVVAQAKGNVVVEHVGNRRPSTAGWDNLLPPDPQVCEGPLDADGPTALPAWYIDDNVGHDGGALCYDRQLTPDEIDAALRGGWVLRARLRVVDVPNEVSESVRVALFDGRRYWALLFGSQADGDPVVRLPDKDRSGPSVTVAGSGYHLYELRYDPLSDAATLFVDGAQRIGTFTGQEWPVAPSVRWGSGDSLGQGHGNYNLVQFEVLRDGE